LIRSAVTGLGFEPCGFLCVVRIEIHPLPSSDKSLSSAKFGRDSSSRYQPVVAGYDSAPSGIALHRYVTSSDQTTPTDHVMSSTKAQYRMSMLSIVALVLLLQARCHRRHR